MPLQSSSFSLIKVSATGNDFLLVDLLSEERRRNWTTEWSSRPRAELTRLWCDRTEGLGADGMVFLEPDSDCAFAWDFYNSDGGRADMCGNAARAVSLYYQQSRGPTQLKFRSTVGLVEAEVRSARHITVRLPQINESEWQIQTQNGIVYDFVGAGVPHAVVRASDLDDRHALTEIALKVKSEPRFTSQGVNVTFVKIASSPDHIHSVTYERGVEGFTRACGTGAIAAAFTCTRGEDGRVFTVTVPGGELTVSWKADRPLLTGPAKILAEVRWMTSPNTSTGE